MALEVILHPYLIVVDVMRGGDLQASRTELLVDILVKDEWNLTPRHRDDDMLALHVPAYRSSVGLAQTAVSPRMVSGLVVATII